MKGPRGPGRENSGRKNATAGKYRYRVVGATGSGWYNVRYRLEEEQWEAERWSSETALHSANHRQEDSDKKSSTWHVSVQHDGKNKSVGVRWRREGRVQRRHDQERTESGHL